MQTPASGSDRPAAVPSRDPGDGGRTGRRIWLALGLVVAGGLGLRVWYADWRLHQGRFWDERYTVANVESFLADGSLRPVNAYYPLLSHLPQSLLLAASEGLHEVTGYPVFAVRSKGRLNAQGYRLSRYLQAVYGAATLLLTFVIGRRLFSARVGLVAALAVACVPFHIHASGTFKPDALLSLTFLAAFYWSLLAQEKGGAARFALAGLGMALAVSSKPTGGVAFLPLVVMSLLTVRREPRRLLLLALSGLVALAAALVLNPFWRDNLRFLELTSSGYRAAGGSRGYGSWSVLENFPAFLVQSHGRIGAALVLAAVVLLAWQLMRRRVAPGRWIQLTGLLVAVFALVVPYAFIVRQFRPQNFVPLLPFTAILLGWLLVAAWDRTVGRLPTPGPARRWVGLAAGLLLVLWLGWPGAAYVYGSVVPSTEDVALHHLRWRLAGRPSIVLVGGSRQLPGIPPFEGSKQGTQASFGVTRVDDLAALPAAVSELADGMVFPRRLLFGGDGAAYLERVASADSGSAGYVEWRLLHVRGPTLAVATHPWQLLGGPRRLQLHHLPRPGWPLAAELGDELGRNDVVSFALWLPQEALAAHLPPPRVWLARQVAELVPTKPSDGGCHFVSPRLVVPRPGARARFNQPAAAVARDAPRAFLYRWKPRVEIARLRHEALDYYRSIGEHLEPPGE